MLTRYSVVQKLSNKQSGVWFFNILGLWHYSIGGRKRISIFMKLSSTHAFNCIVIRVKFGQTSCEDILPVMFILSSSVYYVCGIILYLQHPQEKMELKSALKEMVNALNWVHSIVGVLSPVHSPLVQAMTKGLRRLMDWPVQKKTPCQLTFIQRFLRMLRQSRCC